MKATQNHYANKVGLKNKVWRVIFLMMMILFFSLLLLLIHWSIYHRWKKKKKRLSIDVSEFLLRPFGAPRAARQHSRKKM